MHWIVEKASAVGLDCDDAYLKFFEPHFDSTLHDSMSLKYRVFGTLLRPIGRQRVDGECIHEAAIMRMRDAPSNYAPANLKTAIGPGLDALPIVKTARMP